MRRGNRLGAESMSAWFLSMIESARTTRSLRSCRSSIDLFNAKLKKGGVKTFIYTYDAAQFGVELGLNADSWNVPTDAGMYVATFQAHHIPTGMHVPQNTFRDYCVPTQIKKPKQYW